MYPPPHMTHMYPPPHMTHMYPPPHHDATAMCTAQDQRAAETCEQHVSNTLATH
jgi:hypothetical protein